MPSALLSILGSSIIIYVTLKSRERRNWTPYTRLLLAMSISSIILSVTLGTAPFLRPRETSSRVWAFGNDTSCSVIGFLNQISLSTRLYNAMLSLYFLLTARYGFTNAQIAKRIEPLMNLVSIAYPLVTAVVFALSNEYGEMGSVMGCSQARYNGEQDDDSKVRARLYFSLPAVLVFVTLIVCNLIILCFVRQQTQKQSKRISRTPTADEESIGINGSVPQSESRPVPTEPGSSTFALRRTDHREQQLSHSDENKQNRRMKLVSSQALLFVACYLLCNIGMVSSFVSCGG
jgi:hypothetical protein